MSVLRRYLHLCPYRVGKVPSCLLLLLLLVLLLISEVGDIDMNEARFEGAYRGLHMSRNREASSVTALLVRPTPESHSLVDLHLYPHAHRLVCSYSIGILSS